ncbi:MAG: hypothetical protein HC940_11500 [Acaryochloris sp. SU_5_25]|nr:hypothetical protein [Acaryochloris sp. SU_5_25]
MDCPLISVAPPLDCTNILAEEGQRQCFLVSSCPEAAADQVAIALLQHRHLICCFNANRTCLVLALPFFESFQPIIM